MAKPQKSAKSAKSAKGSKPEPKLKKADKPAAKAVQGPSKGKKQKEEKAPKGHKKARKKVETTFELLDETLGKLHKQLRKVWGKSPPDLTVLTADDRAALGLSQADLASLEQLLAMLLHQKGAGFLDAMFSLPGGSADEGVSSDDGENDGDDLDLLGALADDGDE